MCIYIYAYVYIYMHMYISGHKVQSLPTNMCRHTYITTDHMYINMILYIYICKHILTRILRNLE